MLKKTKWIVGGVALFGVLASVTTALASWVIVSEEGKEIDGNISVGKVDDAKFTISDLQIKYENEASAISFDAKKDDNSGRVRGKSGEKGECLTATITGKVKASNKDYFTKYFNQLKFDFSIAQNCKEKVEKAVNNNYIVLPTASVTSSTLVGNNEERTFSQTIQFGWGALFKGKNPCEFFDSNEKCGASLTSTECEGLTTSLDTGSVGNKILLKDVKTILEDMNTLIEGASFNVNVSVETIGK